MHSFLFEKTQKRTLLSSPQTKTKRKYDTISDDTNSPLAGATPQTIRLLGSCRPCPHLHYTPTHGISVEKIELKSRAAKYLIHKSLHFHHSLVLQEASGTVSSHPWPAGYSSDWLQRCNKQPDNCKWKSSITNLICVVKVHSTHLQTTQSKALGEMWRADFTSRLLRYSVDGVELVHGGSSLEDLNSETTLRNFWFNEKIHEDYSQSTT